MNQKTAIVQEAWLSYRRKLLSFIRARVGTPEDAEDIVTEVFAKLTKTVDEDASPDNMSSWLYRVTRNTIVDYYRNKAKFEQLPDDLLATRKDTDAIKQLSKCMLPMIRTLPETYQLPLVLSEIEGKKYKAVAAELSLSVPAVKSRILRGREKLYKIMLSCCTIYRNDVGETVDFEQKNNDFCSDCDD